jgi:enoyl-CoA hydratase/carnithine racemase
MRHERRHVKRDNGTEIRCTRGRVAVVVLDGPDRLNALGRTAITALSNTYAKLDADDEVRAIVLTGAGRAFCSGADLARRGGAFKAPRDPSSYRSSPPRPLAFQLRKPVVAAINGHAVGLGMTLALHCDARIIAREARWGVVQVRRGVVPDALAHWTLVRSVGTARAAEILLTGRLFAGEEALRLGVANRVLPADEVLSAAIALAEEMAAGSPLSVAMSKRILWSAADGTAPVVDELESVAHRVLMGRPDALEGGRAAFEKREPDWASSVRDGWPAEGPFADPTPLVED